MGRAEGAYKRWASLVLFLVGVFLAVVGNASTTDVARDLWEDAGTRAAVVEAASNVGDSPADIGTLSEEMSNLSAFHLPVGWDVSGVDDGKADNPMDFFRDSPADVVIVTTLGWLLTALLVMLGAPFWFDLLSRLVSIRSSGDKPPPAAQDGGSSTRLVVASATRGGPDSDAAHGLSDTAKNEYAKELAQLEELLKGRNTPDSVTKSPATSRWFHWRDRLAERIAYTKQAFRPGPADEPVPPAAGPCVDPRTERAGAEAQGAGDHSDEEAEGDDGEART